MKTTIQLNQGEEMTVYRGCTPNPHKSQGEESNNWNACTNGLEKIGRQQEPGGQARCRRP